MAFTDYYRKFFLENKQLIEHSFLCVLCNLKMEKKIFTGDERSNHLISRSEWNVKKGTDMAKNDHQLIVQKKWNGI
jgi:5-methylcytosine-specific restriction endonuclease McrA